MAANAVEGEAVRASEQRSRSTTAGVLLGLGLGGFFDGILLHQILQWHHLVSSLAAFPVTTVAGLEVNTLADGLFHAATYVLTLAGLALLSGALRHPNGPWSTRSFIGTLLLGWGAFNLVEGLIDHQLLGIHHVNETVPPDEWLRWDVAFLIWGAAMVIGGWLLWRRGAAAEESSGVPLRGNSRP